MAASNTWSDPNQCPFCGNQLASPGEGFMLHLDDHPDCRSEFENWRDRVSDDIRGGWGG